MKSWPGGRGKGIGSPKDWQQALDSYGFTEEQMLAFRGNPIDYAADLARYRIPILHVVCDEDQVVPPAENTEIFARRYRAAGGPIEVYYNQTRPTSDHGHHFTLDSIRKEVDFVLRAR
jgi:sialidase-1